MGTLKSIGWSVSKNVNAGRNIINPRAVNPNGKIISKLESTEKGVIEVNEFRNVKKTFFAIQGNKIFFYFLIFYTSLFFFIKKREHK